MSDFDTHARAKAQAIIQAHIPQDAWGVNKRALFYALVEALTGAQRSGSGRRR
jgi:hypothetical protein